MGSSSGSLPRGSGPQRVPWDTHLFSPGAGGGWHLPEAPGKEPPQPVQSPRMVSLQVPHLVVTMVSDCSEPSPERNAVGMGSPGLESPGERCAEPRNHGDGGPSAPVLPLGAAPEPPRGHRWDHRPWAPGAVLSGPPPPRPYPAVPNAGALHLGLRPVPLARGQQVT